MANSGTQTDNKLLEYIAELEDALKTTQNKISQLHNDINVIEQNNVMLGEARSKY